MAENTEKLSSKPLNGTSFNVDGVSDTASDQAIRDPNLVAGSGSPDRLVDTARDYASQAMAENTNKAYRKD